MSGLIRLRTVPGKDVDSLIIKAELFKFSPIVLHAASTKARSGFLSLVRGVGTAITTTSESAISAASVVATYLRSAIKRARSADSTPSI